MNKFMSRLEEGLLPLADRIGRISFLTALGATFQILLPVIMIGSFACLGAFLPIDSWQTFIGGNSLGVAFMTVQSLTLSIISLYIAFVLPYQYAQRLGMKPLGPTITTFMSFLLITPTELYTNIPEQWLGYAGMFTVLIVAWLNVRLCQLCEDRGIYIHMPDSVPPMVEESFKTLVPAFISAVVSIAVEIAMAGTSFGCVHQVIYALVQMPLQSVGLSYPGYLLIQILSTLFMFCGIHGNTIFGTISPLTLAASAENLAAFQAGQDLPHIIIDSFSVMCQPGGIGGTLGLAFLCAFLAKSKQLRTLGRIAAVPSIFGINEPLLFGIPIILDPLLFIPYVLNPIVCTTLSYLVYATGIVPRLTGTVVNWAMPQVLSGFLAQGWQSALWQVVLIGITTAIWFPFFRIIDRRLVAAEQEASSGA